MHEIFFNGPFKGLQRKYYKVVYADPPWQFHTWSHRGEGKGASQHYKVMNLKDICSLPVSELVTDDAALFLWVVQPQLLEAMEVIKSWGFEFRTVAFAWIKMEKSWKSNLIGSSEIFRPIDEFDPKIGLGYHTRSGMEQCWLAIRGQGYTRQEQGVRQVLHAPLREHSRKPDEIAERIIRLVGDIPKIELFARTKRDSWDVWGNEVDKFNIEEENEGKKSTRTLY